MIGANPGCRGDHGDDCDDNANNTPSKSHLRCVLLDVVLERADHSEDEPGDTRRGTARVNTTDVLNETGPEDAHPQRRPL